MDSMKVVKQHDKALIPPRNSKRIRKPKSIWEPEGMTIRVVKRVKRLKQKREFIKSTKLKITKNECSRLRAIVQISHADVQNANKKLQEINRSRLQAEFQNGHPDVQNTNMNLEDINRQLESKMELISRMVIEKNELEKKNRSSITLIVRYLNDVRITNETRQRLMSIMAVLEGMDIERIKAPQDLVQSSENRLNTISKPGTGGGPMKKKFTEFRLKSSKHPFKWRQRPNLLDTSSSEKTTDSDASLFNDKASKKSTWPSPSTISTGSGGETS